jgi:cyclophilin family peptidyl-prolyl cis-trans isomerase
MPARWDRPQFNTANREGEIMQDQTGRETGRAQQWREAPAMTLMPGARYSAVLHTDKGEIEVELFQDQAPITVNNFVFLARKGFYSGVTFHRVIPGFMAQTGDPTGTGSGGPGYTFCDEFSPSLRHNAEGILSMANRGPSTNGSQFFITYAPTPHLDGRHTVFGRVTRGMDVVRQITPRDPGARPTPPPGDKISRIDIVENL